MTMDPLSLALALFAGIAMAAASGLRAFLPLLALGIGARFFGLELAPGLRWLTSDVALATLGAATVIEIAGDKLPVVDHALDVVATFVRPVAAGLAAYGMLVHWPAPWGQIIAVALGATALGVHAVKAKTRVGSTVVSMGFANPALSVLEDLLAGVLLVVAFVAPFLVALCIVLACVTLARRHRERAAATPRP